MARPLRIEFAGALYHITARGNERRQIFLGDIDEDRAAFLEVLRATCERFGWTCHAYCLMTNHYHLLVETADANLSLGMRQLNGVYTQYVNRTRRRVGHLFQGRFKGILKALKAGGRSPIAHSIAFKVDTGRWLDANRETRPRFDGFHFAPPIQRN